MESTRGRQDLLYKRLSIETQTRVIVVQPAIYGDEPVRVSLAVVDLRNPGAYDAVSYCWSYREDGLVTFDGSVQCDDHDCSITKSAEEVLRRFRLPDTERRLWLDALCINQADNEERSQQIMIMAQIYAASESTLLWLGHDSAERDGFYTIRFLHAFTSQWWDALPHFTSDDRWTSDDIDSLLKPLYPGEILTTIGTRDPQATVADGGDAAQSPVNVECPAQLSTSNQCNGQDVADSALSPLDRTRLAVLTKSEQATFSRSENGVLVHPLEQVDPSPLKCLTTFFGRRWFGRRWVLQEVSHGVQPVLHCGQASIAVPELKTALRRLTLLLGRHSSSHRAIMSRLVSRAEDALSPEAGHHIASEHPIDVLARFQKFGCRDGRDRIYALLSMYNFYDMRPDYTRSMQEVYLQFAQMCVERGYTKDVLWEAASRRPGRADESLDEEENERVINISWVPDWRVPNNLPLVAGHRFGISHSDVDCDSQVNSDGSLTFRAYIIGPIEGARSGELYIYERNAFISNSKLAILKGDGRISPGDVVALLASNPGGSVEFELSATDGAQIISCTHRAKFLVLRKCSDADRDRASSRCTLVGWCTLGKTEPPRTHLLQFGLETVELV